MLLMFGVAFLIAANIVLAIAVTACQVFVGSCPPGGCSSKQAPKSGVGRSSELQSQNVLVRARAVYGPLNSSCDGWEILWALILGFALSGVVKAVVTKAEMSRFLHNSSLRSIVIAIAPGPRRHPVPTPLWRWRDRSSAKGSISPRRWPFSSPRP